MSVLGAFRNAFSSARGRVAAAATGVFVSAFALVAADNVQAQDLPLNVTRPASAGSVPPTPTPSPAAPAMDPKNWTMGHPGAMARADGNGGVILVGTNIPEHRITDTLYLFETKLGIDLRTIQVQRWAAQPDSVAFSAFDEALKGDNGGLRLFTSRDIITWEFGGHAGRHYKAQQAKHMGLEATTSEATAGSAPVVAQR